MTAHVTLDAVTEKKAVAVEETGSAQAQQEQKKNALLYAYMQILDSVHVSLLSSQTNAMELNACEANMSLENNRENSINVPMVNSNGDVEVKGNWSIVVMNGAVQDAQSANGTVIAASQLPGSILGYAGVNKVGSVNEMGVRFALYKASVLLKKATLPDYDRMQEEDESVQKNRDFFANKVILAQQVGQVLQTVAGSKTDFMSQFIQQDTNIATILSTLSNELAQMLRTP